MVKRREKYIESEREIERLINRDREIDAREGGWKRAWARESKKERDR